MDGAKLLTLRPEDLTWDTACRLFTLRCRSENFSPSTHVLYAATFAIGRMSAGAVTTPPPPPRSPSRQF